MKEVCTPMVHHLSMSIHTAQSAAFLTSAHEQCKIISLNSEFLQGRDERNNSPPG